MLTHPKFKNPMSSQSAKRTVWGIANSLILVSPLPETIFVFEELLGKYKVKSNAIFDLYLVSTALSNGINLIATDNTKDFEKYSEVKVVNPFLK